MPESIRLDRKREEVKREDLSHGISQYLEVREMKRNQQRKLRRSGQKKTGECGGSCGSSLLIASTFAVK